MYRSSAVSRPLIVVSVLLLAGAVYAEDRYTTIAVDEIAGHDRERWPVEAGVPIPQDVSAEDIWLGRVVVGDGEDASLEPVPFQVFEVIEPEWFGGGELRNPVKTIDLVFQADIAAGESARFRLYYGDGASERPAAEVEQPLEIEAGDNLAREVDTGVARFGFHGASGQLLNYRLAGNDRRVEFAVPNRLRPVHHNPDAWSPPHGWGHASGWNIDDPELSFEYQEARGPIAWRLLRTGDLPRSNGTDTSVSYTIYAGLPIIMESSSMRFTRNTAVNAVRNNELVFSRGLHTHGIYIDHERELHTLRAHDPSDPERSFRHINQRILPPDLPFIGLYHEYDGYGIGMVTLGRYAAGTQTLASGGGSGAHYYFNDGDIHRDPERNFLYFTRAEVFNYDWDQWNTTTVPAGALFAEDSVIVAFPVEDEAAADRFEQAEHWTRLMRTPPRVWIKDGVRSR